MTTAVKEQLCRIFFCRKKNQINLQKIQMLFVRGGGIFFSKSFLSTDPICMDINDQNHYHYIFIMERKNINHKIYD